MDEPGDGSQAALPSVLVESLAPFSHLVCSRDGLFAVNHQEWVRVADGKYFGATVIGDPRSSSRTPIAHRSVVVCSRWTCCVWGVRGARLRARPPMSSARSGPRPDHDHRHREPAPPGARRQRRHVRRRPAASGDGTQDAAGYVHFNSLLESGGIVYVMAHNGGSATGVPSRVFSRSTPSGRSSISS